MMAEDAEHCNPNRQYQQPQHPPKISVLDRNNQRWESLKEEIRRTYIAEDNTLPTTMKTIELEHSFTAW